jgi:hypothetical protein
MGFFTSRGNWDQVKNPILINFPSPDLDVCANGSYC